MERAPVLSVAALLRQMFHDTVLRLCCVYKECGNHTPLLTAALAMTAFPDMLAHGAPQGQQRLLSGRLCLIAL
jgi:hypothetical protein